MRRTHQGLLSTLSLAQPGFPFGSIVPFVLNHEAQPIVLLSRLAEHTKNMSAHRNVCLFVHEVSSDPPSAARLSLLGFACRIEDPSPIKSRYFNFFPSTVDYWETMDFDFWKIVPTAIRTIQGFAQMGWLTPAEYTPPESLIALNEGALLDEIKRTLENVLFRSNATTHPAPQNPVQLLGVDCEGFDWRFSASGPIQRTPFNEPLRDAASITRAVINHLTSAPMP